MLQPVRASTFLISALLMLSGCGTYVPNIQEVGDDAQGFLLVKAIVGSVRCELRNSVNKVIENDKAYGTNFADYLDKWAAQVALTLSVEEKSTVNPTAAWTPHGMPIVALGASLTGSADATRKDIVISITPFKS